MNQSNEQWNDCITDGKKVESFTLHRGAHTFLLSSIHVPPPLHQGPSGHDKVH